MVIFYKFWIFRSRLSDNAPTNAGTNPIGAKREGETEEAWGKFRLASPKSERAIQNKTPPPHSLEQNTNMQSQRQKIGQTGEDIATEFLKKKGYKILARNFKTKWGGELDIVAKKNGILIFAEVKTLKYSPLKNSDFSPEDEITFHKANQLRKMAQIYLSSNRLALDTAHQIDILAVELLNNLQVANIRHTENAIEDF